MLSLFFVDNLPTEVGQVYEFENEDAAHAVRVLRIGTGEIFNLSDGAGRLSRVQVVTAGKKSAQVKVLESGFEEPLAVSFTVIQAIPKGQMEAALSLGMSRGLALRRVIIPQATRLVLPPMTNDFIALFKDTAVCSVITVVELSKQYYIQARSADAIVELGLLTALLYLAMSYPLSMLTYQMEKRLNNERPA